MSSENAIWLLKAGACAGFGFWVSLGLCLALGHLIMASFYWLAGVLFGWKRQSQEEESRRE